MEENTTTKTQIKTMTLANLWKKGHITGFSKLRTNSNNYPFLTLFNGDKVTNLYFSKAMATFLTEQGFEKGEDLIARGVLSTAEVVVTENTNGDQRFKIALPSTSNEYSSRASAEAAFGVQEQSEFPLQDFLKEFKLPATNAVTVTEQ